MRRSLPIRSVVLLVGATLATTAIGLAGPSIAQAAPATPSATATPATPTTTDDGPEQLATGMMPADSPDAAPNTSSAFGARACAAGMAPPSGPNQPSGLDVASYQHVGNAGIDFGQVAASGQRFVVVKATESTTYTNPFLVGDVAGARAAGMYAAAYHFARPGVSAVAQADYFAQAYNSLGGTLLPPVLDLENNGGLAPGDLINWTAAFLSRLQADTGRIPMIYTGPSFWNTSMAGSTSFTGYPLWVAHYTDCAMPQQFGGWGSWTFWQFSNGSDFSPTPSVPGIAPNVDRDRAGSEAQLAALAVGPFDGSASAAQFPDGTFVEVAGTPAVYRIAGLSPIYVSSWANVGGQRPVRIVSAKEFSTLRAFPLDGTFLNALPSGAVYRVAGGAPVYVSSWAPFGAQPYVDIDQVAVANAGTGGFFNQLRALPADGTFLNALPSGAVYRIAGGAPVYISSWAPFGGGQPYVSINDASVDNAGAAGFWSHLRARPAEGTFLNALPSGAVYRIAGGAPVYVSSWAPFGGGQPYVTVNDASVDNAGAAGFWSHLLARPADGTFLLALPSGAVYHVAGGAPVYISDWTPLGGVQPYVSINDATIQNAGAAGFWSHLFYRPTDGTFLNALPSGAVYRVSGGVPVYVPSWSTYGGVQPYTDVNDATVANHGQSSFWSHLA